MNTRRGRFARRAVACATLWLAACAANAQAPSAARFDAAFAAIDAEPRMHDDQALFRGQQLERLRSMLPPGDPVRQLRYEAMRCGEDVYTDAAGTARHAGRLLQQARRAANADAQIRLHYCHGNALSMQRSEQAAVDAYTRGIELSQRSGRMRLLGEGLQLRASTTSARGEPAAALLDLMQVQRVYERAGLTRLAEGNVLALGTAYRRMGEHDKALPYLKRSEKSARERKDLQTLYTALVQQGYLHHDRNDAVASARPLEEALQLAERHGFVRDTAIARIALAASRVLGGEHARALHLLAQAEATLQSLGESSNIDLLLHLRRGQAMAGLGRHRDALGQYAQVQAALSGSDNLRYRLMLYRARAASLEAMGRNAEALAEYRGVLQAETALERITQGQQETLMRHQFNVSQRELEHRRLAAEKALQEQRLQAQLQARRWQRAALATSMGLLFVLAALGIGQLRRSRRLHTLAMTDALTGVPNRRSLERFATRALATARARSQPVCLLAIDVDRFKAINDRYGHAAGDAVLRRVAGECQRALRKGDHLGRTGGEEFVAVLPLTSLAAARPIAQRLLAAIEALDVQAHAAGLQVTVSIGIAEYRDTDDGFRGLVRRADAALYHAKRNGRNRIECDDGTLTAHALGTDVEPPATGLPIPQPGTA